MHSPGAIVIQGEGWALQPPTSDHPGVQLWTARRLPFSDQQDAEQRAMVRQARQWVQQICGSGVGQLSGVFASSEVVSRQPDAENIVYYNFGLASLATSLRVVNFERSFRSFPHSSMPYYHCWRVVDENQTYQNWTLAELVAEWTDLPLSTAPELGLATWLSLRGNLDQVEIHRKLAAKEKYAIQVQWNQPGARPLLAMKGLLDGALAALQRADQLSDKVVARLLGRKWPRALAAEELLGLVALPQAVFPRSPFNGNGLDPCDEACVAGQVRLVNETGDPRFSGQVWRVVEV
jgi:hypothetical protein